MNGQINKINYMPNHVATNFSVTGPKEDVIRFLELAKGETLLDFNKLVPMPDELRETRSPVLIQTQAEIDDILNQWEKRKKTNPDEPRPWNIGITPEKSDELISKYGANNWYDFSVNNWGTKWNCYSLGEWNIREENENSTATIYYETAWSPATRLWVTFSSTFPTLSFYHEFADEGGGFLGSETIEDGEITETVELEWDSDVGIEMRTRLGNYHPEDEEN